MPSLSRIVTALSVAVASAWMCQTGFSQERVRTVVAVHWSTEEYPATPIVNAAIRKTLASTAELPIEYFSEYLESDLFPPAEISLALRDYLRRKYRGRRIDVVIAIADPALQFVLDYRDELFPGAPIVFSGVNVRKEAMRAGAGLTAVLRGVAYVETLKVALALHPSTRQVFVIARSLDQRTSDSVRAELDLFSRQVRLTYVNEPTLPQLLAAVKALTPGSLILYIWHSQREPGNLTYTDEAAQMVAAASAVPVYGTNDRYIGTGVVGGVVRDTSETATRVGEMAREILQGRRPQDIPIETARLVPTFDWHQLQRWGIEPSQLPEGSFIRFRVPTAWESYRSYIIATVAIIAAQLLLIGGLVTQRARRRHAEEIVRTREATLRSSYERIRQLAGRLITAQEAARGQIARDLHDDVCQDLVGVSMGIRSVKRSSGQIQEAHAQHALWKLHRWSLTIAEGVRRLSHDLHPVSLQLLGLPSALRAHCVEVEKRHDVQVEYTTKGTIGDLQPDVALCLFRIAQEALRNGAVHGGARRLGVSIAGVRDDIELTVTDDGRGFDVVAVRRDGSGLGLVSMEERAHLVGGDLHVVSAPGQGTKIVARVPAGAGVDAGQRDAPASTVSPTSPLTSAGTL